ncbi:MAG: hypothetical protein QF752_02500 [Planctomycetota bacterium]|nr:hypothetical protein [Planctomycetota bacterium]
MSSSTSRPRSEFSVLNISVSLACATLLATLLSGFASGQGFLGRANAIKCRSNLKQIGLGVSYYAETYSDRFPDRNGASFLAALYVTEHVPDNRLFLCPASRHENHNGSHLAQSFVQRAQGGPGVADGTSYLGRQNHPTSPHHLPGARAVKNASKATLAADEESSWHGEMRHFLFLDSHVESIQSSKTRFKKLLVPLLPPGQGN